MDNIIKKSFYAVIVRLWKKRMKESTAIALFVIFFCLLAAVVYFYYKPYPLIESESPNGAITASLYVQQSELGQYPTVYIKILNTLEGDFSMQPLDHPSISIWFGRNSLQYTLTWESDERFTVTKLNDSNAAWSVGVKPLLSVTPIFSNVDL